MISANSGMIATAESLTLIGEHPPETTDSTAKGQLPKVVIVFTLRAALCSSSSKVSSLVVQGSCHIHACSCSRAVLCCAVLCCAMQCRAVLALTDNQPSPGLTQA